MGEFSDTGGVCAEGRGWMKPKKHRQGHFITGVPPRSPLRRGRPKGTNLETTRDLGENWRPRAVTGRRLTTDCRPRPFNSDFVRSKEQNPRHRETTVKSILVNSGLRPVNSISVKGRDWTYGLRLIDRPGLPVNEKPRPDTGKSLGKNCALKVVVEKGLLENSWPRVVITTVLTKNISGPRPSNFVNTRRLKGNQGPRVVTEEGLIKNFGPRPRSSVTVIDLPESFVSRVVIARNLTITDWLGPINGKGLTVSCRLKVSNVKDSETNRAPRVTTTKDLTKNSLSRRPFNFVDGKVPEGTRRPRVVTKGGPLRNCRHRRLSYITVGNLEENGRPTVVTTKGLLVARGPRRLTVTGETWSCRPKDDGSVTLRGTPEIYRPIRERKDGGTVSPLLDLPPSLLPSVSPGNTSHRKIPGGSHKDCKGSLYPWRVGSHEGVRGRTSVSVGLGPLPGGLLHPVLCF